jgi:hypothetical protein
MIQPKQLLLSKYSRLSCKEMSCVSQPNGCNDLACDEYFREAWNTRDISAALPPAPNKITLARDSSI